MKIFDYDELWPDRFQRLMRQLLQQDKDYFELVKQLLVLDKPSEKQVMEILDKHLITEDERRILGRKHRCESCDKQFQRYIVIPLIRRSCEHFYCGECLIQALKLFEGDA